MILMVATAQEGSGSLAPATGTRGLQRPIPGRGTNQWMHQTKRSAKFSRGYMYTGVASV